MVLFFSEYIFKTKTYFNSQKKQITVKLSLKIAPRKGKTRRKRPPLDKKTPRHRLSFFLLHTQARTFGIIPTEVNRAAAKSLSVSPLGGLLPSFVAAFEQYQLIAVFLGGNRRFLRSFVWGFFRRRRWQVRNVYVWGLGGGHRPHFPVPVLYRYSKQEHDWKLSDFCAKVNHGAFDKRQAPVPRQEEGGKDRRSERIFKETI